MGRLGTRTVAPRWTCLRFGFASVVATGPNVCRNLSHTRTARQTLSSGESDGTHELTIRVFENQPQNAESECSTADTGGPPRIALEGTYDSAAGEFVVVSNPESAPDTRGGDVAVEFLPHDASALDAADIETEGTVARIPVGALDGPTSVYAAPFDGSRLGVTDQIRLDPQTESVSLPNRPPEWLDDAVVYEIFTRSFAGEPGATDLAALTERVTYLRELGVDVVWLTPVLPAWSPTAERPPGGPHGYSVAGRDTSAYPRLPVSDECSDALSEPRSEQAGVERTA